MTLPVAPPQYDRQNEAILRKSLDERDLENFKKGRDVELARGERLIMRDTNGVRYKITVSTAGALVVTAL